MVAGALSSKIVNSAHGPLTTLLSKRWTLRSIFLTQSLELTRRQSSREKNCRTSPADRTACPFVTVFRVAVTFLRHFATSSRILTLFVNRIYITNRPSQCPTSELKLRLCPIRPLRPSPLTRPWSRPQTLTRPPNSQLLPPLLTMRSRPR